MKQSYELKNTAEIDELDRKQARMLACSKPLTEAETIEMENFISGELTNHGRAHGILATASTSSLPREIAIQSLSSIATSFQTQPSPMHTRSGIPIRSHSANSDTPRKKVQAAEFINTVWDRNSKKCKKCNQPMDKKMMIDHFRQVHNDVIQSLGVTFL